MDMWYGHEYHRLGLARRDFALQLEVMRQPTSTPWIRVIIVIFSLGTTTAQAHDADARVIRFPDLPTHWTLVTDLHQHTVFSDGKVWPTIRVEEGVKDGVDVMSITEHLEYQPHRNDIPHPDRNRSYEIARKHAEGKDIMVVHGAEITRKMPPGHVNAVFIQDANLLRQDDPVEALREAVKQGAFTFWNHPAWWAQVPSGVAELTPMHEAMLKEGLIGGIEVVNETTFSEAAMAIALEHDLTIMGTSDIHGLIDWEYGEHPTTHRPVTLVFAKERTPEAVKAALVEGSTVVWFNNVLIGRERWMNALLDRCITVKLDEPMEKSEVLQVELANHSDADFMLQNVGALRLLNQPDTFTLPAQSKLKVWVIPATAGDAETLVLEVEVLNAVIAPGQHAFLSLGVGER